MVNNILDTKNRGLLIRTGGIVLGIAVLLLVLFVPTDRSTNGSSEVVDGFTDLEHNIEGTANVLTPEPTELLVTGQAKIINATTAGRPDEYSPTHGGSPMSAIDTDANTFWYGYPQKNAVTGRTTTVFELEFPQPKRIDVIELIMIPTRLAVEYAFYDTSAEESTPLFRITGNDKAERRHNVNGLEVKRLRFEVFHVKSGDEVLGLREMNLLLSSKK